VLQTSTNVARMRLFWYRQEPDAPCVVSRARRAEQRLSSRLAVCNRIIKMTDARIQRVYKVEVPARRHRKVELRNAQPRATSADA